MILVWVVYQLDVEGSEKCPRIWGNWGFLDEDEARVTLEALRQDALDRETGKTYKLDYISIYPTPVR